MTTGEGQNADRLESGIKPSFTLLVCRSTWSTTDDAPNKPSVSFSIFLPPGETHHWPKLASIPLALSTCTPSSGQGSAALRTVPNHIGGHVSRLQNTQFHETASEQANQRQSRRYNGRVEAETTHQTSAPAFYAVHFLFYEQKSQHVCDAKR